MHGRAPVPVSPRPRVLARATAIGIGYFLLAVEMILLTRFDGGLASLWLATSVLTAELMIANRAGWWASIITCLIANFAATALFSFGPVAALPFAVVNVGEAMLVATLLRRLRRAQSYLDSLEGVIVFALVSAIIVPGVTSVAGAGLSATFGAMPFSTEYRTWLFAHGLGMLTFTPLMTLILTGRFRQWWQRSGRTDRVECAVWVAVMMATSLIVFGQSTAPLLFVPILPLIIIAFRLEQVGTVMGIIILATVGGLITMAGHGPVRLLGTDPANQLRLFQFYLATTTLTVLPVAAELSQRRALFRRVGESEARFKLITESSTDMIISLDRQGIITYASPSAFEVTGFTPEQLVGRRPHELACGPDQATMDAAGEAIKLAGRPTTVEYPARTPTGENRWFEAHTRGLFDGEGHFTGWVSAIRDISVRKALELRLAHAASTDPLTGLANRRRFDSLLERKIDDRRANRGCGCIALFDIDFFKRVNDAYGHAVGDLVLETFAAAALRSVRGEDHVARLGGEEFGIILEGATVTQAIEICERVRHAIARDVTRAPDGTEVSVTVSAGVAEITPGLSRLQLMRAADEALYRAKAGGRDQLALAA